MFEGHRILASSSLPFSSVVHGRLWQSDTYSFRIKYAGPDPWLADIVLPQPHSVELWPFKLAADLAQTVSHQALESSHQLTFQMLYGGVSLARQTKGALQSLPFKREHTNGGLTLLWPNTFIFPPRDGIGSIMTGYLKRNHLIMKHSACASYIICRSFDCCNWNQPNTNAGTEGK